MYVHSVKLVNYKSIGDYAESEIIVEPRVTAIIGKNESGKSNILDGLSRINFTNRNPDAFAAAIVNRIESTGKENYYQILLKPDAEDIAFGIDGETEIFITKNEYVATGGVMTYFLSCIYPHIEEIASILGAVTANPMQLKDQEYTNYRTYYGELLNKEKIDVPRRTISFTFLISRVNKLPIEKRAAFETTLVEAQEKWQQLVCRFPMFFYRKTDKHLKAVYKYEDVEKELKTPGSYPDSMLSDFVRLLDVTYDDFLLAARSGVTSTQNTVRNRIRRNVGSKINEPFSHFYHTESVYLEIEFNNGSVIFQIRTGDGESLSISERSNGLRWYMETFIDSQANEVARSNVVYLLDEPGTSLHVNAQKELISLFNHLADQGNQVVYTTHSPYMLDTVNDGIHRIRAVVKDVQGYTRIYKTAYDNRISPDSVHDTLAPIISALGMNMNDTFGPAKDKINIVTEGTSDYIYMCMMAKLLGIDSEKYAIIPSQGASNCVNICAIMHGWGCRYIAVLDYDKAGVETGAEVMRNQLIYNLNKDYCFMNEVTQEEIDSQTYKTATFMVEDVITREEINRFCEAKDISPKLNKALIAKKMSNAIDMGEFTLSEIAINNSRALFERVLSYA